MFCPVNTNAPLVKLLADNPHVVFPKPLNLIWLLIDEIGSPLVTSIHSPVVLY